MITKQHETWSVGELQALLERHIFNRDRFAETYSERSDLNKEIQVIKSEINRREKSERIF